MNEKKKPPAEWPFCGWCDHKDCSGDRKNCPLWNAGDSTQEKSTVTVTLESLMKIVRDRTQKVRNTDEAIAAAAELRIQLKARDREIAELKGALKNGPDCTCERCMEKRVERGKEKK